MQIIDELEKEAQTIYLPNEGINVEAQKMLIVVHSLKLGGSLVVLLELMEMLKEQRYQFYVISAEDGPYREKVLAVGAVLIIRPFVVCSDAYKHILQENFDYVLINSLTCYYYIYYFINTKTKVIWWFHETVIQLEMVRNEFPNLNLLSDNIKIVGVMDIVRAGVKKIYGREIGLLHMPLKDCTDLYEKKAQDKVTFFIPAGYTYIKGQDVLLQAIAHMPENYRVRSQFVFCGYQVDAQKEYYERLCEIAERFGNVKILGELEKAEVYQWYKNSDCVIAPSRVDAGPSAIAEGMMFGCYCIVSNATGISDYIKDCENGFVFPSENTEELLKRIMIVIAEKDNLRFIAENGRRLYEERFLPERVLEQWEKSVLCDTLS